jgi:hypothetical protein
MRAGDLQGLHVVARLRKEEGQVVLDREEEDGVARVERLLENPPDRKERLGEVELVVVEVRETRRHDKSGRNGQEPGAGALAPQGWPGAGRVVSKVLVI